MCLVKTGRWAGVVTAFITMSDIKDEIDWEFPGAATTEGQTNYFWQGVIRKLSSSVHNPLMIQLYLLQRRERTTVLPQLASQTRSPTIIPIRYWPVS